MHGLSRSPPALRRERSTPSSGAAILWRRMTRRSNHPLALMTRRAFVRGSTAGLAAMGLVGWIILGQALCAAPAGVSQGS